MILRQDEFKMHRIQQGQCVKPANYIIVTVIVLTKINLMQIRYGHNQWHCLIFKSKWSKSVILIDRQAHRQTEKDTGR